MIFSKAIGIFRRRKKTLDQSIQQLKDPKPKIPSRPVLMNPSQNKKKEAPSGRNRIKIDLLIHDLKVPLAVIEAGITSILTRTEKYGPLTEKQEKVLHRTLRNTKITKNLVNDALELGRSREGIINLSTFDLSSFIEQALVEIFDLADWRMSEQIKSCRDLTLLKEILEKRGIYLNIDEKIWCEQICIDAVKLTQILRNLLNNALKYRKKIVELGVGKEEQQLVFFVKDDGEGIPVRYHKKIFESYFQMDNTDGYTVRGHGLGLAGVMALVEDMRGELNLESDEGKGAKFLVKVPLSINR